MLKGFGKGRDHGRSSRTPFPPHPPPPPRPLLGGAGPPGPAERQLTWRVSCALNGGAGGADGGGGGRRRRGAGCRLGPLCGGGSGAWPRRGALFRPGLCPPPAGEKAESGGGWARWGRGCTPRLPPPQADRLVSPTLARQATASPHGWGGGAGLGARFYQLPLPHHTKGKKAPGWDNGASRSPSKETGEGKSRFSDYNKRGSIPVRSLPRGNFLFLRGRRAAAGWKFLCKVLARLEWYPSSLATLRHLQFPLLARLCPAGRLGATSVRAGKGPRPRRVPLSWGSPALPARPGAPRQRGGCAAAPSPAHGSRSPAALSPAPCYCFFSRRS